MAARVVQEGHRQEIQEAFTLFDTDRDGALDFHEFKVAMRALGVELTTEEARTLLSQRGAGGASSSSGGGGGGGASGGLLVHERDFFAVAAGCLAQRNPFDEVMKAFSLFDGDRTGRISVRDLRRVARELGEDIPDDELEAMVAEFDTDKDGAVNQEEFLAIMMAD